MTDADDLIPAVEACRMIGGATSPINPSTLWRWVKAGRVSPPIKISPGTVRFRRSVLSAELGLSASAAA